MSQWKTCSGQEKPNGSRELQWGITGKRQNSHRLGAKQPKLGLPLSPCSAAGMPREGWGARKGSKAKGSFYGALISPTPQTSSNNTQQAISKLSPPSYRIPAQKNQVFPRKTPSQKEPVAHGRRQHPEHRAGKGSPGARGAPAGPSVLQALEFPFLLWNEANPMQTAAPSTPALAPASPR